MDEIEKKLENKRIPAVGTVLESVGKVFFRTCYWIEDKF